MKKLINIILIFICSFILFSCNKKSNDNEPFEILDYEYGVFLGASNDDIDYMKQFHIIVIDAQYYTNSEIEELKGNDNIVYSYINVGALEDFRDYYDDYKNLKIKNYEDWPEEIWIDCGNEKWQNFIINELSESILSKGVDGLFVDNIDVYYFGDETKELYDGITLILEALKKKTYVFINSGDTYIYKYLENNNNLDLIIDGVNQETVLTRINFNKKDTFYRSKEEDFKYFSKYCSVIKSYNKDVYLLEYSKKMEIVRDVDSFAKEKGYKYYVSKTLELLAE